MVVANAALPATGVLTELGQDEIDRILEVNLRAPITLARAIAPGMIERGRGHLVFVSSLAGKATSPASSMYSATKFGLRGFALALRMDLAPNGVGVSVVLPGFIRDAGMFADANDRAPEGRRDPDARSGGGGGHPCGRARPRRGRGRPVRPPPRGGVRRRWRRGSRRASASGWAATGSPPTSRPDRRTSGAELVRRELAVVPLALAIIAGGAGCGSGGSGPSTWSHLRSVQISVAQPGLPPPGGAPHVTSFTSAAEVATVTRQLNAAPHRRGRRSRLQRLCRRVLDPDRDRAELGRRSTLSSTRCGGTTFGGIAGDLPGFLSSVGAGSI